MWRLLHQGGGSRAAPNAARRFFLGKGRTKVAFLRSAAKAYTRILGLITPFSHPLIDANGRDLTEYGASEICLEKSPLRG